MFGCGEKALERPAEDATVGEKVDFYMARIGDPDFVQHLEHDGPRIWYTAAEELGGIGAPAIPPLIERMRETEDPYERKVCFYALRLAAQGPEVVAVVGRSLPDVDEALPPEEDHARVRELWGEWWEVHGEAIQRLAAGERS